MSDGMIPADSPAPSDEGGAEEGPVESPEVETGPHLPRRPSEPEDDLTSPLPGIVLFLTILAASALSVFLTGTPAPLPAGAPADQYSAERAFAHIQALAAQPRPVRHTGKRHRTGVPDRPARATWAGAPGAEGDGRGRPVGGARGERARARAGLQERGEGSPHGGALRRHADRTRRERRRLRRRHAAGVRPRPEGPRSTTRERRDPPVQRWGGTVLPGCLGLRRRAPLGEGRRHGGQCRLGGPAGSEHPPRRQPG